MGGNADRLSARRVCALTGVRPQTRDTWVDRGLLRSGADYGELDVIEQAIVKQLLGNLAKADVRSVWEELREHLRSSLIAPEAMVVWDVAARVVEVVTDGAELRRAVCHGRPVHVLPLGQLVADARRAYRQEVEARRREDAAKARRQNRKPGQAKGG
jgi:uncharacterized protein YheU (UPF0270 family)